MIVVKVVILAGGLGTRMREETALLPKPMVPIGDRPILWHIMSHYASYGHTDFIIAVGHKGNVIKDYFLSFEAMVSGFSKVIGANSPPALIDEPLAESGWKVTIVDTGALTPTGGRLKQLEKILGGEDFFCTYGDGLSNIDLDALASRHADSKNYATVSVSQPNSRFGIVDVDADNNVTSFAEKPKLSHLVSIGFFVMSSKIFDYLSLDLPLEGTPLRELTKDGKLGSYFHEGFWQPMDTPAEMDQLNEKWRTGRAEWKTWDLGGE